MNSIEILFLDNGLSWTWSKITPYLISFVLGFILVLFLKKKIANYGKLLRIFFQLFAFSFFFILYFSFYPIYEGDFTNSSVLIERTKENSELTGQKIVVLSIPGCPYCYESINRMNKLIERNPSINVEYLICSDDESSLEWYKEGVGNNISVSLAKAPDNMAQLAEGSFPTFVLVDDESKLKVWSNSSFGVLAMDEVEAFF